MSARQSAASYLEGIPPVPIDTRPQSVFFDRFGHQIDRKTKHLGQLFFENSELEKVDTGFPVKLNQKINITVWSGFTTRHGSE